MFAQSGCHGLKAGSCRECIDVWCSCVLQTLLIASSVPPVPSPHPSIHYLQVRDPGDIQMGYFWMLLNSNINALQPYRWQACPLAQAGLDPHLKYPSAVVCSSRCCMLHFHYAHGRMGCLKQVYQACAVISLHLMPFCFPQRRNAQ